MKKILESHWTQIPGFAKQPSRTIRIQGLPKMTTNNARGGGSELAIYYCYKTYRATLAAIRAAANTVDPMTGQPDDGALITALGLGFNVWCGDLLSDPQAEVGILQPGVAIPDQWEDTARV